MTSTDVEEFERGKFAGNVNQHTRKMKKNYKTHVNTSRSSQEENSQVRASRVIFLQRQKIIYEFTNLETKIFFKD